MGVQNGSLVITFKWSDSLCPVHLSTNSCGDQNLYPHGHYTVNRLKWPPVLFYDQKSQNAVIILFLGF